MPEVPMELRKSLYTVMESIGETSRRDAILSLKKAMPASKNPLVQKKIVDKTGKQTTVWVNPVEEQPEQRTKKQEEPKDKRGKSEVSDLSKQAKLKQRVEKIKQEYPSLTDRDIKTRMKHGVPMDATDLVVFESDPKYTVQYKDNKGRLQKRYTEEHKQQASEDKFERISNIQENLSAVRKEVADDLNQEGLGRDKICAVVVRLIDKCYLRIGNDKYTEQNGTYGVSTLTKDHVNVKGNTIEFDYVGKSSMNQHQETTDTEVAELLQQLKAASPGDRMFQYKEGDTWKPVTNATIRTYLKQWDLTPKDFRTYHATRLTSEKLANMGVPDTERERERNIRQAIEETAKLLGHTPAICKKNYVNSKVLEAYQKGVTMNTTREGKESEKETK